MNLLLRLPVRKALSQAIRLSFSDRLPLLHELARSETKGLWPFRPTISHARRWNVCSSKRDWARPKLELQPAHLRMVLDLVERYAPDAEVSAYGNRVQGTAHEGSDWDLVLRNPANPKAPQRNLTTLAAAFAESNLPILVDIIDWARIPETFRQEIERAHAALHDPEKVAP